MKGQGRKYRNLIYTRLWWQITPICITIFTVCLAGSMALPDKVTGRALAGAGILFLLAGIQALSYGTSSYIQCRPRALRLRYPLYTLNVPYEYIEVTQLTTVGRLVTEQCEVNKKRKPSWSERRFLGPLWNEHVIVIRFRKMPRVLGGLGTWIGRRWLVHNGVAVVVRDWMSLRREIDLHLEAIQARLRQPTTTY